MRLKTLIVNISIGLCIFLFLSWFGWDDYLSRYRPSEPNPQVGQMYSHIAGPQKLTVYITRKDLIIFALLPTVSGLVGVTTFLLKRRWRVIV